LHLIDYELPAEALVFVEAYRQTTWMRFPFGTVANLQPPENRVLSEFESIEHIKFRVKVTQAENEHILLAEADRIPLARPDENAERESILPVHPAELGDELWQVDMEDEPRLLVNKSATADWRQLAQSPLFVSLVYPAVLRQILAHILTEGFRDTDDESEWRSKWLRFATLLPGVDPEVPAKQEGEEAALRWAEVGNLEARRLGTSAHVVARESGGDRTAGRSSRNRATDICDAFRGSGTSVQPLHRCGPDRCGS
jgi:hypothetical protein